MAGHGEHDCCGMVRRLQGRGATQDRLLGVMFSNVAWAAWGWSTQAWALVSMQFALAAMNIRGAYKNKDG